MSQEKDAEGVSNGSIEIYFTNSARKTIYYDTDQYENDDSWVDVGITSSEDNEFLRSYANESTRVKATIGCMFFDDKVWFPATEIANKKKYPDWQYPWAFKLRK